MRAKKRILRALSVALAAFVMFAVLALGVIMWHINQSVIENTEIAQQAHPHLDDDVASLVDYMNSDTHSLWERNHRAVWTLGQLRDPRALPALEKNFNGVCDHNTRLCQYELRKAVKLCGGSL